MPPPNMIAPGPIADALASDSTPPEMLVVPEYVLALVSVSVPVPDFVKARLFSFVFRPPMTPPNVPLEILLAVRIETAALPPTIVPPEPVVVMRPNVLLDGPDPSPSTSRPNEVPVPNVRPPAETTRLLPPARTSVPSCKAVAPE